MKLFVQIPTTYQWQTNSHTQLCFSHHNRDVRMTLMVLSPHSVTFSLTQELRNINTAIKPITLQAATRNWETQPDWNKPADYSC